MKSLLPRPNDFRLAVWDLIGGAAAWRLWTLLALQDIRQRYRRSTIGPFWLTITMGINILAMSVIWSALFKIQMSALVPYLTVSLIIWTFISTALNEGGLVFISAAGYIKQVRRPHFTYVMWLLWRNSLVFLHNIIIYPIVVVVLGVAVGRNLLWLAVTVPLLALNLTWLILLLGLLSTRFRDIPAMVQSALTILFFVTPILWRAEQLAERGYIATFNPLTHLIDIVRAPLLGEAPSSLSLMVSALLAVAGWAFAFVIFSRFRSRIAYWI